MPLVGWRKNFVVWRKILIRVLRVNLWGVCVVLFGCLFSSLVERVVSLLFYINIFCFLKKIKNNVSLLCTLKLDNFNIFWILSLISWTNTFKNQEFRQIIENFHHVLKICKLFIIIKYN